MFWRDASPIETYKWYGYIIEVNLSFDRVLTFLELLQDEELSPEERYYIALELFVTEEVAKEFTFNERVQFVVDLVRDKLGLDFFSNEEDKIPAFDFMEDAGRIHASFLFDYQMDLYEKQGEMSWATFQSLLHNLSPDTQFAKAVHYRTAEIPRKTDYNKDEIDEIKAMKERYAFKSPRLVAQIKAIEEQNALRKMEENMQRMKQAVKRKGGN